MNEMQGIEYVQETLPGMEYCEFGCLPLDHGDFEYGEPDDILKPPGKNWCAPCQGWIDGQPCDE